MENKNTETRNWISETLIKDEHKNLPIKQVYVWIFSQDAKIVLVSKDSKVWQLPGGKPEKDETITRAAIREVREETGLEISTYAENLKFLGYYTVKIGASEMFLQVRLVLDLPKEALTYLLSPLEKTSNPEAIRFCKAATLEETKVLLPWLATSPELQSLQQLQDTTQKARLES